MGLPCEICHAQTGVVDSRPVGLAVVRQRNCCSCASTSFTVELPDAILVRPDGEVEAFDPRQYFASIREAVRGEKVNSREVTMASVQAISEAAQIDPRFGDLRIQQAALVRETLIRLVGVNPAVALRYLVDYHRGWETGAELERMLAQFFPKPEQRVDYLHRRGRSSKRSAMTVVFKAPQKRVAPVVDRKVTMPEVDWQEEIERRIQLGEGVIEGRQIQGITGKKLKRLISGLALRADIPLAQISRGVKLFLGLLTDEQVKFSKLEDTVRNHGIVFDYFFRPLITFESLGELYGLKRQRAEQIVKKTLRNFCRQPLFTAWRALLPEQSGESKISYREDFIFGNEGNLEPKKKVVRPPERRSFGRLKREGYLPLQTVLHRAGLKAHEDRGMEGISDSTVVFLEQNGVPVIIKSHGPNRPKYHYIAPERQNDAILLLRQWGQ